MPDVSFPSYATSRMPPPPHPPRINTSLAHEQMAIWYMTWGVLAYVMTLGKSNRQSRDWVFTGQIVMLAMEVSIITTPGGEGVLPSWFFPKMAEYEVGGCVRG